jgi:hypothetical protein
MNTSANFTFDDMNSSFRQAVGQFPDKRRGKNTRYKVMDAASCAFSTVFTQCPSLLSFQTLMQQKRGKSNVQTIFHVGDKIPTSNQIRNILKGVSSDLLSPVFMDCFTALSKAGIIDSQYRVGLGKHKRDILVAIDGVDFHASYKIECKNCLTKKINGETLYMHKMVTPTIVCPGNNRVLSLPPEYIFNTDGATKQDCEINGTKRILDASGQWYALQETTFLGDDLFAHEPMCLKILRIGCNFIFTCKPDSHKTVYEWTKGILREVRADRFNGKKHLLYTYRYAEQVPLRESTGPNDTPLLVNFVEVTVKDRKTKKQVYHNAFITSHPITGLTEAETKGNLNLIIDCGRARWKIENENNNTLKTKGYNLEHNFGHQICNLLASMNLLAFLFHTVLEFMDEKYLRLREVIGARKRFFEQIRSLLIFKLFDSFRHFMKFMADALLEPDSTIAHTTTL